MLFLFSLILLNFLSQLNLFLEDEGQIGKMSKEEALARLPKLTYLHKLPDGRPGAAWYIDQEKSRNKDPKFNAEKAGLRQCLMAAFKEESKIQLDGIKSPPGVLVNKIYHFVFNYDLIQDEITKLVSQGKLDCCDAVEVRMSLKEKLFPLCQHVIDTLSFPMKLPGNTTVEKEDVVATLKRFYKRDQDELIADRIKQGCGDCGGARSSGKRIVTPVAPQPIRRPPEERNWGRSFRR